MDSSFPLYQSLGLPLPTPAEMASWDEAGIHEFRIPETLLMENASREAFHVLRGLLKGQSRILIIMGGGNNGGDGAALARHLLDAGHQVLVCHTQPLTTNKPTLKEHITIAVKAGVPFIPVSLTDNGLDCPAEYRHIVQRPHMLVDALLGTGFSGTLREQELAIVRCINAMGETVPVFSLDIPSGLDGLTGMPRPEAVRARHTVTFEAAKVGLAFPHAAHYTGTLHVRRIGLPSAIQHLRPASFRRLAPDAGAWPEHGPDIHKGQAGRVMIFGGSQGLTGAPALTAIGTIRSGAGLVTVACPSGLEPSIRPLFPEVMTLPLGNGTSWSADLAPACIKAVSQLPPASCLAIGPGMGRSHGAADIIAAIIADHNRPPLILDADALYPLGTGNGQAPAKALLTALREEDCITPHPGEAAHILETSPAAIQEDRVAALRALTTMTRAVVVLKGAGTLLARGNSPVFVAPFASPSLAVGGSGDILTGIIAALLAKIRSTLPQSTEKTLRAACLGVFLHGKAGEYLDRTYPHRGALAREIADAIPHGDRYDCHRSA